MASEARRAAVLALAASLGCGAPDESSSASATATAPLNEHTRPSATSTALLMGSASTSLQEPVLAPATDDRPPAADAREDPALLARTALDANACGALALPPAAFVIDSEPHAKGGWSYAVGDLDGDKRLEIATTSTAYRSVRGDFYSAVHVEEKPGCFRFLGIAYGSIVTQDDPLFGWREPGALLVSARSHWLLRDEVGEYRKVGRRLVLHRTRACLHDGETGDARCTAWAPAGDVPLTPDRELAIPEEMPAASALTPVPPPRWAIEDLQDERHR